MKKETRIYVWHKYKKHCSYCGGEIKYQEMQVDHLIPQIRFEWFIRHLFRMPKHLTHLTVNDVNHIDNLMPSCRYCNNRKSDADLEFFRSELSEQLKRANKTSANYRMAKRYGQVIETPKPIVFYFEKIGYNQY